MGKGPRKTSSTQIINVTKAPLTPIKHGLKMENSDRKLEHRLLRTENSNEIQQVT